MSSITFGERSSDSVWQFYGEVYDDYGYIVKLRDDAPQWAKDAHRAWRYKLDHGTLILD
ncbi:MAG: hypothetical protein FWF40_00515 [Methanomassiliicoccaceae archaeon]|nr:hypothetical protein [Methanomassiliicoccaceae archaeon]